MTDNKAFSRLEQKLGYEFKNKKLLETSLIHSSLLPDETKNNERLEFHGDRVLALVVVDYVTEHYPKASVGELALRLNRVVSRNTCAEIAKSVDLGDYLTLGNKSRHSGIRRKTSVLSGVIEAVLGAVYLDGGLEEARKLILNLWKDHFSFEIAEAIDPKSELQEIQHLKGMDIPTYRVLEKVGPDHSPEFLVEASLSSGEKEVSRGKTKKEAESKAAKKLLNTLKARNEH